MGMKLNAPIHPPVAPWTNGASQAAKRDFFTANPGSTAVPAASASSPTSPMSWFCRFLQTMPLAQAPLPEATWRTLWRTKNDI